MSLTAGTRLGPYEIGAPIGKGGMGEVYRARDTKLGRDVAIKVLPDELAVDEERVARFEREAKLLASMNHPNIASIHGFEESDGVKALVLELVEGSTLAQRLEQGPIVVDEAIVIAKQIADALEAGHEVGVIHRDLKPANIKLKEDGTVKVLDYGLAKALEENPPAGAAPDSALSQSPTLTRQGTQLGMILGTAAYMAPEQAKGKRVDKRSDVWAFGVVLFEMLTGDRLYTGETVSDILAAVIKDETDWGRLPAACPPHIRRLLERCLTRDPKQRLRDIGEARIVLETGVEAPSPEDSRPTPLPGLAARLKRSLPWAIAAGMAVALWLRPEPRSAPPSARFSFSIPPNGFRLPGGPFVSTLAVSPDGSRIVYAATHDAAPRAATELYVRPLNELEASPLPNTESAVFPFFSADGRFVAFAQNGRLRRVAVDGGTATTVTELGDAGFLGGVWISTNQIIYAEAGVGLKRVNVSGGDPELILAVDADAGELAFSSPDVLPGNRHVVFSVAVGSETPSEVRVLSLDDGKVHGLIDRARHPRFAAPGYLLFERSDIRSTGTIYAAALDARRAVVTGEPFVVQEDVTGRRGGFAEFAVSANGVFVYNPDDSDTRMVVAVRRDGSTGGLISETGDYRSVQFSPDGRKLLLERWPDVWVYDRTLETMTRITSDMSNIYPTWTPDAQRVTFARTTSAASDRDLYWAPADGSGAPELLLDMAGEQRGSVWSPNGRFVAFNINEQATAVDRINHIWYFEPDAGSEPEHLSIGATAVAPAISPDSHFIAYTSNLSGRYEIYVQTFPEPGPRVQVSANGGSEPVWSRDGSELFFRSENELMAASVDTGVGTDFRVISVRPLFDATPYTANIGFSTYDVDPNGTQFAMLKLGSEGTRIVVVLNWLSELEALSSPAP